MSDMVSREGILRFLKAPLSVTVEPVVTSTNRLLREQAQNGAKEGTVLIAETQTEGHGRFDRRFFSPQGTGLYMSVLLRPRVAAEQVSLITPAAAVAVSRAVRAVLGKETGIKWVNDVYLDGRKVCGILTESAFTGNRAAYTVVGIGINVYVPQGGFPTELQNVAAALAEQEETDLRHRLAAAVLNELWLLYQALPDTAFMQEYISRSVVIGKEITVCRGGEETIATAREISENGHLLVQYQDGTEEWLAGGEISVKL